jgi:hypothetical protein
MALKKATLAGRIDETDMTAEFRVLAAGDGARIF